MKTIPVSLIVAGFLTPAMCVAQAEDGGPGGPPPRAGEGPHGGHRPFVEAWKAADKDADGFISREEFGLIPRIQGLPEEKRAGLFTRLDKDADGKLDRGELGRIGRPREGSGNRMPRLWELDVDKSGGVSFEEFKAGRVFQKLAPEKQQAVFHRLDTNGDGMITPKDNPEPPFRHDRGNPRPKRQEDGKPDVPRVEPRQLIRQLDQDGNGTVTFEEFRAGPRVRDLTEDEQEDRFEALDKNHDLKITVEDFPPPAPHREPKRPMGPPPAGE